jgi:hypothetical protein
VQTGEYVLTLSAKPATGAEIRRAIRFTVGGPARGTSSSAAFDGIASAIRARRAYFGQ